jgi:signal transduction histidine kinase
MGVQPGDLSDRTFDPRWTHPWVSRGSPLGRGSSPPLVGVPIPPSSTPSVVYGLVLRGRSLLRLPATPVATERISAADVALAAAVALASLLSLWLRAPVLGDVSDDTADPFSGLRATLQLTLACAALTARRRAPGTVLVVTIALLTTIHTEHYPVLALPYPVLVAAYTVAQRWPRRSSVAALGATLAGMTLALLISDPALDDDWVTILLGIIVVWALGHGVQMRQTEAGLLAERARLLEDHARHLADEQTTLTELAAERERATIARELHDIVANNVSIIVAWATMGRRTKPESVDPVTLQVIEGLGRETLGDMRRLVGVLHTSATPAAGSDRPCLDRLPGLVDKIVAGGTPATLAVTGAQRELSAAVEVNAYRIVQEALTNALKHAAGSRIEVTVDYDERMLRIGVRDYGDTPSTADGLGSGLLGMRQRVSLLGGQLMAGPVSGEPGFAVDVSIPLNQEGDR